MLSTLAAVVVVGHSAQHRPIALVHVAGPGPRLLVVGCIHGDEPAGIAVVRALARAHPHADLWLVPVLNPDGLARGTRADSRGVDLNANFGSEWAQQRAPHYGGAHAWSEPETRVARALIERIHPAYTVWFHQHLDLVWAYGRSSAAGRRYARLAGMRYYHHHWLHGSATNWQNHLARGDASITVELPAGALSPAAVRRHVRAVLGLAG